MGVRIKAMKISVAGVRNFMVVLSECSVSYRDLRLEIAVVACSSDSPGGRGVRGSIQRESREI